MLVGRVTSLTRSDVMSKHFPGEARGGDMWSEGVEGPVHSSSHDSRSEPSSKSEKQ